MGQVIGQTDHIGARPSERPFDPQDFLATMSRYLEIDPAHAISDPTCRPIPLSTGQALPELA